MADGLVVGNVTFGPVTTRALPQPYWEAVARFPLTPEAFERATEALAVACCGGNWSKDFTEEQRQLWRDRVRKALAP